MLTALLIVAFIVLVLLMAFAIQGPPFVVTNDDTGAEMLKLVQAYRPKRIIDIGSGNGKLVILLASEGHEVDGIELNPLLVWRSRRAIKKAGLENRASIKWGNFWAYDTAKYDIVTLYVVKHIMPRLEKKLKAELKPGSHVISNYFIFPNLKPAKTTSHARAYTI